MNVVRTTRFIADFTRLSPELKLRTIKQLQNLERDPRHPSLHTKRVQGSKGIFEVRISLSCRLTFHLEPDTIILRRVGEHDKTLKNP